MADAAATLPGEKAHKIPRRHYSAVFVLMSLLLVLSEGLSLRGARAAFVRCYFWLQRKMPSHTAIRDWILQVGYYKLTTIQKSEDWIGMIDLSIQIGAKKCLLILGVQTSTLLKGKPLTFEDVHVLHMELLEKSSGAIICEVLKKSEEKVGRYVQFCHDSDAMLKELLDQFGWVRSYKHIIQEVAELLLIGGIVRQKIRTEGIHKKTSEELDQALQDLAVGERANQFAGNLVDFVVEQAKGIEQVALGSTEIIESSFGNMKQLMDEETKDGFTPFVLSLAACIGKLDLDIVQAALKTCSKKQVKAWAAANVGETIYSQRRRLFNPFKKRKKEWATPAELKRGPDDSGIFNDQVVNL